MSEPVFLNMTMSHHESLLSQSLPYQKHNDYHHQCNHSSPIRWVMKAQRTIMRRPPIKLESRGRLPPATRRFSFRTWPWMPRRRCEAATRQRNWLVALPHVVNYRGSSATIGWGCCLVSLIQKEVRLFGFFFFISMLQLRCTFWRGWSWNLQIDLCRNKLNLSQWVLRLSWLHFVGMWYIIFIYRYIYIIYIDRIIYNHIQSCDFLRPRMDRIWLHAPFFFSPTDAP